MLVKIHWELSLIITDSYSVNVGDNMVSLVGKEILMSLFDVCDFVKLLAIVYTVNAY